MKRMLVLISLTLSAVAFGQAPTPTPTPAASPSATPISTTTIVELESVNVATLTAPAPAATGAMTVNLAASSIITITPTGPCTFNSSGTSRVGKTVTFVITTTGTTARVLTFGTNFKAAGTLSTGIVTAKQFCVTFRCLDGTLWIETARTASM